MNPVTAYRILKEHKTDLDIRIREKTVGLFLANSFLFVAFFMSMPYGKFVCFRSFLPIVGIALCIVFAVSLSADNKARSRSIKVLVEIEIKEPDFDYLEAKKGRPITDIEEGLISHVKHPWLRYVGIFWPLLSVLFIVAWALILKGI